MTMTPHFLRLLPAVLLLAACSTVQVQPTTDATGPARQQQRDAFGEAHALAASPNPDQRRIEALLVTVDNDTLARRTAALAEGDPLYPYAGRSLQRRGLPLPRAFTRNWKFDGRAPAENDGYRPPARVALLLPSSAAGNAVRDGFMTGYFGEARRRPEVRLYDTGGNASAAYERAVADGMDYVVGPLGREEVDALFARGELPVPVLALNRGDRQAPAGSVGFSLSPEDEGVSAADYLLGHNLGNVLLLVGGEDSMRRTANSLAERLGQRGGSIVQRIEVGGATDELLPQLQAAQAAGAQAVFVALRTAQARRVAEQLDAAGLLIPRFGTSLLDTDGETLRGVAAPTEAWGTRSVPGLPSRSVAAARIKTARGPAGRLFAFGYDAWLLTGYLGKLATDPNAELPGATGGLRIDGFGNIVREPVWTGATMPIAPPIRPAGSGG